MRGKIASLDLFSGVGGITHALRDVAHPVGYCEVAPDASAVLQQLIADGKIPDAPIHPDVRMLDGTTAFLGVPGPTMIAGGFPCTAISVAGRMEGLAHPGTGLFFEIVRLVREARPDFVFLENVAAITEPRQDARCVLADVVREITAQGYDMRWGCFPGYQVGSPQRRHRWFCLCYKPDAPKVLEFDKFARFEWALEPAEPRMVPKATSAQKRVALLGNSVVPDVVNLAFRAIWTGFALPPEDAFRLEGPVPFADVSAGKPAKPAAGYARFGETRGGEVFQHRPPRWMTPAPDVGIVLDPDAFVNPEGYVPMSRTEVLTEVLAVPLWPSPRYCNGWRGARTLTQRGRSDLGTVVRFARSTTGSRTGYTSPRFVEWLMGFPPEWTRADFPTSGANAPRSLDLRTAPPRTESRSTGSGT